MRDPNRIQPILDALGRAWRESPDMRLGQLVWNITARTGHGVTALALIEDDKMLEALEQWLRDAPPYHQGAKQDPPP